MSLQVGAFRFDTFQYNQYTVYFDDVSGLNTKAEVDIAGVKVGWVEDVELVHNGQQVLAKIMVHKNYRLHADAYGVIRQDGLLGTKFLEIHPGDARLPTVKSGGILMKPSTGPVAIDEMLQGFQSIAENVEEVTKSLKTVFGGDQGVQRLDDLMEHFSRASEYIASLSQNLDEIINTNEHNMHGILEDLQTFSHDLKSEFPQLSQDLRDSVNRISQSVDEDFGSIAHNVDEISEPVSDMARKINEGKGVIGQLVNDEQTARDFTYAVHGVKNYFAKIDQLAIVFDAHGENMTGPGNRFNFEDSKGYFNVRIHPVEDYFYLAGLVATQSGFVEREEEYRKWFDSDGNRLVPEELNLVDAARLGFATQTFKVERKFDQILYNLQLGRIYDNVAFRAGLFENSFGVAVDFDIPFQTDYMRWVTSFEAFDFNGRNRIGDDRPHLKWLNKVFFGNTLYFVFGADDFASKTNKNAFVGAGFRFADDDVKYLMSQISISPS
jgi:phospholipid/cholesterol/gamma-HCH transport system substrate-binding protein